MCHAHGNGHPGMDSSLRGNDTNDAFMITEKYKSIPVWARVGTAIVAIFAIGKIIPPVEFRQLYANRAFRILDRNGAVLRVVGRERGFYVPLRNVSPQLVTATLCSEDRRFYWHCGIDPIAEYIVAAGHNHAVLRGPPVLRALRDRPSRFDARDSSICEDRARGQRRFNPDHAAGADHAGPAGAGRFRQAARNGAVALP